MEREKLINLLKQYYKGTLSEEDFYSLQRYLNEEDNEAELMELWDEVRASDRSEELSRAESARLLDGILADERLEARRSGRLAKVWGMAIAASVAACLLLVFAVQRDWFGGSDDAHDLHTSALIVPGGNKARIELDNGEVIDLEQISADSLIKFDGFTIQKLANGSLRYVAAQHDPQPQKVQYNTLVTPAGGEYRLVLPDGSRVAMNASSRLRYPVHFGQGSREVELTGEAYFEVRSQLENGKRVPFIVTTGEQQLKVLGTQFNIRNYGDLVETTLVEGSVQVSYPTAATHVLKPNEQAVYRMGGANVRIASVDPFYITAWKNGSFAFNDAGIREVMDEIARWYDVEVAYSGDLSQVRFSGTISRFEDIDKLLTTIALTGAVTFDTEGRRIMVKK